MIIYDLSCDNDHHFEGWFRSPLDFEGQLTSGVLSCPQCNSHLVRRIPSVTALGRSHTTEQSRPRPAGVAEPVAALMPPGTQLMAMYRQFVEAIVNSSEDVGRSFADEARKIHHDEAPQRPIRGQATPDECEALRDDGIDVINFPLIPKESLN